MPFSVGFIGLGLMGAPMAQNLLRNGWQLTVWNRTRIKTKPLADAGAKVASTPRELAEKSDIVITIVSDPPALEDVMWGKIGVLDGLKKNSVLIDSSTVSPGLARRLAEACAERSAEFLDAPVTGGTWGAEKGELVYMIGGRKEVLEKVQPVLNAMGKKFFHIGGFGAGQTVKLAMNSLLALQVDAFAEALALVRGAGLEAEKLVEVMQSSMARAAVLDVKAPMMLEGKYNPSFPLRLMHKDLGLALELANQIGVALPATAAAREVYNAVKGATRGDVDYAAVARFWEKKVVS